jgi:1-aminocyclopropane-1-carboxylate deaminase/D-cysteine desulfhydrase-like pyridoxal-dependent ACC family enzyme
MESTETTRPLLFERYPELGRNIAYLPLDTSGTKVERLSRLGHDSLWIKRDDRLSPAYGGNKVRKLEFVLGDALQKGAQRIVTIGGIGTNHGLATAIFCRQLGIACTLILFDQQVTSFVRNNLRLFYHYGADLIYCPSMYYAGLHYYLMQRLRYPQAYFLPAGGSSPIGTLGHVNAAFELLRQVEAGEMPPPGYIFCPTASNGTLAGLSLGFALAGFKTTVIGVRVGVDRIGPLQFNTPATAAAMMQAVYDLLKCSCRDIPVIQINPPLMLNDYVGDGYGILTVKGLAAVELFKEEAGINLEPVYTGKTCAAVLDFIKDAAHAHDTVLFWNTFNAVDLSSESQAVDYHQLPKRLHHCFESERKHP